MTQRPGQPANKKNEVRRRNRHRKQCTNTSRLSNSISRAESYKMDCANESETVQNIKYREENPKSHEKWSKSRTESKIS